MTQDHHFLEAMRETLAMAFRALTTNMSAEEKHLTVTFVKLRLAQINKEIEKTK